LDPSYRYIWLLNKVQNFYFLFFQGVTANEMGLTILQVVSNNIDEESAMEAQLLELCGPAMMCGIQEIVANRNELLASYKVSFCCLIFLFIKSSKLLNRPIAVLIVFF